MHFSKVYGVTNFSIKVTKNDVTSFKSYRYMAEKETIVPDSFIYIKEKLLDTRNLFFIFSESHTVFILLQIKKRPCLFLELTYYQFLTTSRDSCCNRNIGKQITVCVVCTLSWVYKKNYYNKQCLGLKNTIC